MSLYKYGFPAKGISSDLDQDKREEVMGKFRARRIRILGGYQCHEPGY